jgi:hypothetical protein
MTRAIDESMSLPIPRSGRAERSRAGRWWRLERLARWEFWPALAVYAPLIPALAWYALRSRGVSRCTAVNPAIPLGGLVGESKSQILALLPTDRVAPSALIAPGPVAGRLAVLDAFMSERGVRWPLILKPDVGERGTGVRKVADRATAEVYLRQYSRAVLAQAYHPGPFELGVFYIRHPRDETGRLFSITDKRFPSVVGDGASTLADLIRRDPRLRLQQRVFLERLGARQDDVPALGHSVQLGVAGNHCRGATFLDGHVLATEPLRRAFDQVTRAAGGLFFGRFDIRYADADELAQGRGFSIIEMNGLLSEPTHIYHPGFPFWRAQRVLREQWRLAYEIGDANARAGAHVASVREVLRGVRSHLARPDADAPSD